MFKEPKYPKVPRSIREYPKVFKITKKYQKKVQKVPTSTEKSTKNDFFLKDQKGPKGTERN